MTKLEGIYVVLDASVSGNLPVLLDAVIRGGVRIVQYRSKGGVDRSLLAGLCARAEEAGVLLIVNDDLDAACGAGGLHMGQEDLAAFAGGNPRERLGNRVFGVSCSTAEEAVRAERMGADYIGVGPYNATSSKDDAGPPIGSDGLSAVVRAARIPVAVIGGIGLGDLAAIARSGARMAALISAVAKPERGDAESAARALVAEWERARRFAEAP